MSRQVAFLGTVFVGLWVGWALGAVETPVVDPPQDSPRTAIRLLLETARDAISHRDYKKAETLYLNALSQDLPIPDKREALMGLGRLLEESLHEPVKAATVYEQILSLFPQDPAVADLNLRLGRIYRSLGSNTAALNKFYEVLYSVLRLKDGQEYKGAALRAQIEIAHTQFLSGQHAQAERLYARLKLVELPPGDRQEVDFRSAYVLLLSKDYANALPAGREFLKRYPEGPMAPEIQYVIIQCLRNLKRDDEALQETLTLLRAGAIYGKGHPKVWAYWQERTGNDLANELYQSGDILRALTVYQTLAEISNSPEWRWPAVYQIGLCFERLRYPARAIQAYQYILDHHEKPKVVAQNDGSPRPNIDTLCEMSQWRIDHIHWLGKTQDNLTSLIGKEAAPLAPEFVLNDQRGLGPQAVKPVALPSPTPLSGM